MLTLVATLYNVEIYLEDFLESLDRQTGIRQNYLSVVLVDDGSSDLTVAIARKWQQETRYRVTIIERPNGGPGAARNAGLDACATPWVTFLDSDDILSDNYISEILDKVEAGGESPSLIATNIVRFIEAQRQIKNDHPLKFKFRDGNRTVHLKNAPHFFQLSSSTSVFQMDVIREKSLRFDTTLMVFEDAKFIGEYLLCFDDPTIAVLSNAQYFYRRRSDQSSLVPSAEKSAIRFSDVPERAYVYLINAAIARFGVVPEWLQAMIVYDLYWTISLDAGMNAPARSQDASIRSHFVGLLREIVPHLSVEQITYARAILLPAPIRDFLLALKGELKVSVAVTIDRLDPLQQLMRARYIYPIDSEPRELFNWNGELIAPTYSKRRGVRFFDHLAYMERIIWLPATMEISMYLDDQRALFYRDERPSVRPVMHEWLGWNYFVPKWQRPSVTAKNHDIQKSLLSARKNSLRYPDGRLSRSAVKALGGY